MMEVHQSNVKTLEQTCLEVLKDHLCPENCIRLWRFTKAYCIPIFLQLKYEAFRLICVNFEEVSFCEEFLQLAGQELADILGQDDLTVTQESTVYQSVLRWIDHMPEIRQEAIATLLPKVRLGLMDKSYITDNVLNNDVVKRNPESHLLVFNTLQVMSKPSLLCSEPGINNILFCPRLPNAVLLMVRSSHKIIETFDYSTNSWITVKTSHRLKDLMTPMFYPRLCFLGRCLYFLDSGCRRFAINKVWKLNLITHTLQEMSPMQESRTFMSVITLKGCMYAMGGECNCGQTSELRSAERYKPEINQWMYIASMNEERSGAGCTTLNNKIYICGGRKTAWFGDRALNTAEYYNPDTNQWTLITPMGTPRYQPGAVAYMGHIFAVGGINSCKVLRSVEAYDPVTNTWYDVPDKFWTHSGNGIAVMNKQIFAITCSLKERIVECYDYTTNSWSEIASDMTHFDCFAVYCVISGLPNMAEYCSPREPVISRTNTINSKVVTCEETPCSAHKDW